MWRRPAVTTGSAVKALEDINDSNNDSAIEWLEALIREVEAQSGVCIPED
jgi:hypothetical protein